MAIRTPYHLLPILLAYLFLVIGNETERRLLKAPQTGRIHVVYSETTCSWQCHNATTNHCLAHHTGLPEIARKAMKPAYFGLISLLQSSGNYRGANLLFLAILWPLLLSALFMRCLRLRKVPWTKTLTKASWLALFTALILCTGISKTNNPYEYLTDFILTLSRWSGLSYFDINALVFIVIWPLMTLFILVAWPAFEIAKYRARSGQKR